MTRRLLVSLATLALVSGACGSRVRDWPEETLATPTTTESAVDDTSTTTEATTEVASGTTTTSRAGTSGATTTTNKTAAPAAIPAPQPGTYTYDAEIDAPAFEDEPATHEKFPITATWTINRSASGVDATEKLGSADEDGSLVSVFRIDAAGLALLETDDDSDSDTRCKYSSALIDLKAPYNVGQKWRSTAKCTMPDGYVDAVTNDGEITAVKPVTIGGKSLNGIVVRVVQTTKEIDPEDPGDPYESAVTITTTYDAATLLPLISEQRSEEDDFVFTFKRTLRSATPK